MKKHVSLLFSGLLLLIPSATMAKPTLKAGDPAPAIKVAKWFKGQPVENLEKGTIHVVEFWATWCAPCRKSIPHLTEIAKKYKGKVSVTGVSIWESEKTDHAKRLAKVEKFVTKMGDKMGYNIAADNNDDFMANNWMKAAGKRGIPVAFIVDKTGIIAWIGYPWDMDEKLEQVVAGTLDKNAVAAEAARVQAIQDAKDARAALLEPVNKLHSAGKSQEAVDALDKVIAEHPELAETTDFMRYKLLLGCNETAAYQLARKLLEGKFKDKASVLYVIARDINELKQLKNPDRKLAVDVAYRAAEIRKFKDSSTVSVLASSYYFHGDLNKAVETATKAVNLAKADQDSDKGSLKYMESRLKMYKAKQAQAAK